MLGSLGVCPCVWWCVFLAVFVWVGVCVLLCYVMRWVFGSVHTCLMQHVFGSMWACGLVWPSLGVTHRQAERIPGLVGLDEIFSHTPPPLPPQPLPSHPHTPCLEVIGHLASKSTCGLRPLRREGSGNGLFCLCGR